MVDIRQLNFNTSFFPFPNPQYSVCFGRFFKQHRHDNVARALKKCCASHMERRQTIAMKTRTGKQNDTPLAKESLFKECTMCGQQWSTKDDFLEDEEIHLNGYQWNKKKLRSGESIAGLLIFTHAKSGCRTTLGIEAGRFRVVRDCPK